MPVKIRLQRRGRKKRPFYHIVIADSRAPRDGRFIEKIGSYNPLTKPALIEVDRDKAYEWLMKGAQPTDTVRAMLRFKGVMFKKHLMRGVKKGALTQEEADAKLKAWIEDKEAKITKQKEAADKEIQDFTAKIAGVDMPVPKPQEEAPEEVVDTPAKESIPETPEATSADADTATPKVAKEEAEEQVKLEDTKSDVVAEAKAEETPDQVETKTEDKSEDKANDKPGDKEEDKSE